MVTAQAVKAGPFQLQRHLRFSRGGFHHEFRHMEFPELVVTRQREGRDGPVRVWMRIGEAVIEGSDSQTAADALNALHARKEAA
jgi:hypothetical protein